MKYALLLYADEAAWDDLDPEAQGAVMAQHEAATQAMQAAGAYVGGEALSLTNTARTLRLRDGSRSSQMGRSSRPRRRSAASTS